MPPFAPDEPAPSAADLGSASVATARLGHGDDLGAAQQASHLACDITLALHAAMVAHAPGVGDVILAASSCCGNLTFRCWGLENQDPDLDAVDLSAPPATLVARTAPPSTIACRDILSVIAITRHQAEHELQALERDLHETGDALHGSISHLNQIVGNDPSIVQEVKPELVSGHALQAKKDDKTESNEFRVRN